MQMFLIFEQRLLFPDFMLSKLVYGICLISLQESKRAHFPGTGQLFFADTKMNQSVIQLYSFLPCFCFEHHKEHVLQTK